MDKLTCHFCVQGGANSFLASIFNNIFERLKSENSNIEFEHIPPNVENGTAVIPREGWGSSGGHASFQIVNPDNNKDIVLSFCDRGMDIVDSESPWWEEFWSEAVSKYEVVQYIGGLGIFPDGEKMFEASGIKWHKFLPYGSTHQLENGMCSKYTEPYDPTKKERKVCFYGAGYQPRLEVCEILSKHPLFDIVLQTGDPKTCYYHESYYENIKKSKLGLSFNGAGEISVRDIEYFQLSIPVVRPFLNTPFLEPLISDIHYVSTGFSSSESSNWYPNMSHEEIAQYFIDTVENVIDDDEKLKSIANNGNQYFKENINISNICNKFFEICDLDKLK